MKPDTSQWRDHSSYDFFDALSTEGLAWECLRRSADYQRQYRLLVAAGAETTALAPAAQQRWGLRFPGPPRFICISPERVLVAGRQPGRAYADRDPRFPVFQAV
ncbi:transcriptional regulator domain-containing protein [Mesorhizobium retamae]|uniref:DUF6499 domain-containing protein n=1 Tax=Mesorhizobium retamae TaxID=2912854 RepID=A0ABS9QR80_9HYPH|nr:DUF6499 domain-containing protein [Mesorhizobium sp. IRAMC:0171]MCG7509069.1 DUF6499 domain-containing protein [Mesorhizobium sp. IRAMC:0171]